MTDLYKTDLQQIIEYKESTEKQKAEKKALRITIAAILGSLAIGGIAMLAANEVDSLNNNSDSIEYESIDAKIR